MVARLLLCLFVAGAGLACEPEALRPPPLWEGARWFDDWYVIDRIDGRTIAIVEPRYYQLNVNYLILGEERALIFDTGPGERDIRPVVDSLTSLPVTAVFSHSHFDHVGNHERFDSAALLDIPELRNRTHEGIFTPGITQYLGFDRPSVRVTEWWKPGQEIDLGGRRLQVIRAPGHTPDSLVLIDREANLVFTGDFICSAEVFAFTPGADLGDYLRTTRRLLALTTGQEILLGGHGPPRLRHAALGRLEKALRVVLAGEADWERTWLFMLPLRLYRLEGTAILTGLFPNLRGPVPPPDPAS